VDYLFWGRSQSGRRVLLLVELKGKNFGKALEQIESTLRALCKQGGRKGIHQGNYTSEIGHEPPEDGGVKAFVVLSSGRGVPQRFAQRRKIQKEYDVIVYESENILEFDGLDAIFDR
jgi:hypothetical protein